MKLLTETVDPHELIQLRILFESKGIPIFVSNEDAARNFGFIYPARRYGIFVLYEEQYPDAVLLLEDDSHVVINTIDMDQHRAFMQSQKSTSLKKLFKVVMIAGVVLLILFFVLVKYLSSIHASKRANSSNSEISSQIAEQQHIRQLFPTNPSTNSIILAKCAPFQ